VSPGNSRPAPKRVGIISLGCAKNLVDTEVMLGHLDQAGWQFVQDPAQAEVILINTCGFIDAAREESVQTILEVAEMKKSGPLERVVVAGCMVQQHREELQASIPEVDAFIGLDELDQVVSRSGTSAEPTASPLLQIQPSAAGVAATYLYDDRTPRLLATPPWSAYVKIAEGCDHTCAFCSIPNFRGSFRSRAAESILREAAGLTAKGVRELNLIAQDSSHYGRDRGESSALPDLLEGLDGIDALRWIRLHYLYPNTVTEKLIGTMARLERVLDYVDLPLQHAHADMLRRMRRGGSANSHLRLLDRFRVAMPQATLRTTLIVGFPGETEDEYEALLEFVREARFDHLGVFVYSHEEETAARALADDVPAELKEERRAGLMEAQREIVSESNAARVGQVLEVLVEGVHDETEHLLVGRHRGQAPDVDSQVLINDGEATAGHFHRVKITETAGYDLVGSVIDRVE